MADRDGDDFGSLEIGEAKLSAILVGIGSAALVLTIYHCIAKGWCCRRRRRDSQVAGAEQSQAQSQQRQQGETLELASLENSTAHLIPAHKYQKGMALVADDGMCPICLSQFEEGEELRTLPECLHSYHAPCIDMWFYSHSSCPMCRSDATPAPSPLPQIFPVHQPDAGSGQPEPGLDLGTLHSIVQSRRM